MILTIEENLFKKIKIKKFLLHSGACLELFKDNELKIY